MKYITMIIWNDICATVDEDNEYNTIEEARARANELKDTYAVLIVDNTTGRVIENYK